MLVAIAVQNIPEGTVTAIPLAIAGVGRAGQVAAAIATSLPQPVGAVLAYLLVEEIRALLPFSFGFAAGAMLALVAVDVAPDAWRPGGRVRATAGALVGRRAHGRRRDPAAGSLNGSEERSAHAGATGAPVRGSTTTGCVEASMSACETLPAKVRWTGP